MMDQFKLDLEAKPNLFILSQSLSSTSIPEKIRGIDVPDDLRLFWGKFGGGEIFESEDILLPDSSIDGVEARTAWEFRNHDDFQGFIFHSGYCLTVVRQGDRYTALNRESLEVQNVFMSFDAWYQGVIRKEFAARYGLK